MRPATNRLWGLFWENLRKDIQQVIKIKESWYDGGKKLRMRLKLSEWILINNLNESSKSWCCILKNGTVQLYSSTFNSFLIHVILGEKHL